MRHASAKEDKSLAVDSSGMVKMKIKEPHLEADTSTDLLVRQAFTRRGLGMEQANLVGFANHEAWAERLFVARYREPPPGYAKITI